MSTHRKNMSTLLVFSMLFFLSSCMTSRLAVYTDYLSHETVASYFVDTPDPYLNNPVIGQRLIITWTLKKRHLLYQDLHLKIFIRFNNKKEIIVKKEIASSKGTYVYALLNEDYITNKGILTYKVELIGGGQILDEWCHQMWTNLVLINENSPPDLKTENGDEDAEQFELDNFDFEN